MSLLLAVLFIFPHTTVLRAEELTDGYAEITVAEETEDVLENAVDESELLVDHEETIEEGGEELFAAESPEEYTEELCDELDEVSSSKITPTITGFYNSSNGGDIRWSKVDGASGYVVYRMRSAEGLKKVATINNPDTVQIMDEGIKENCWGRVYTYYVRAILDGKEGPKSESVTLQRLAPMKFTAWKNSSVGTVDLRWDCAAGSNKAHGYEIQIAQSQKDLQDRKGTFDSVVINSRNQCGERITGLKAGTTYYFRIRSYVVYTHSVTKKQVKTWSQYSKVVNTTIKSWTYKDQTFPTLASMGLTGYSRTVDAKLDKELNFYKKTMASRNIDFDALSDYEKGYIISLSVGANYYYSEGSYNAESMLDKGYGTCFAYSDLVYCLARKAGITSAKLTVPGRNVNHTVKIGNTTSYYTYGSLHRTVVIQSEGSYYDLDANRAFLCYTTGMISYSPEKISKSYADYLTGKTNSYTSIN